MSGDKSGGPGPLMGEGQDENAPHSFWDSFAEGIRRKFAALERETERLDARIREVESDDERHAWDLYMSACVASGVTNMTYAGSMADTMLSERRKRWGGK